MAATYWQGTTGAWGTAGNWSNGLPSVTVSPAVFDGRSQQSVTSGLDQGAALFQLKTDRTYRGNIGASGGPLKWGGGNLAGIALWHTIRGAGNTFLEPLISATEKLVVDAGRGSVFLTTATIGKCVVKTGRLNVASTVAFGSTYLYLLGASAVTTIEAQATTETAPKLLVMRGGSLVNKRRLNTSGASLFISGGTIVSTGSFGNAETVIMQGGVIKYKPLTVSGGPVLSVLGGLFDFSEAALELTFTGFIMGPDGAVKASALQTEADVIVTDHREDFVKEVI